VGPLFSGIVSLVCSLSVQMVGKEAEGAPTQVGLESTISPKTLVRARKPLGLIAGVLGSTPYAFCSSLRTPRKYSSRQLETWGHTPAPGVGSP
jgi:hypothetical protein